MIIKNFQIANNTITKNKIKLTGQNALTGEDIKISPTSNNSIKQVLDNKADAGSNQLVIGTGTEAQLKFNATNTDARIIVEKGTAPYPEFKYNNTSNKWEFTDNGSEWKALSQIGASYGENAIELPITETLPAFVPVGFDSSNNVKKLVNDLMNVNHSCYQYYSKVYNYNLNYSFYVIKSQNSQKLINILNKNYYEFSTNFGEFYSREAILYTKTKQTYICLSNNNIDTIMACNTHGIYYYNTYYNNNNYYRIYNVKIYDNLDYIISTNYINFGTTNPGWIIVGDDCFVVSGGSTYCTRYNLIGNSYSPQYIYYTLSSPSINVQKHHLIEYTSTQFLVRKFTDYYPTKLKTNFIYNIPSGISMNFTYWTHSGYFIDINNNKIFWDDNDGQGIKVINSPIAYTNHIYQLNNNWYIILGTNTCKIVPEISTTLNYDNYPTKNLNSFRFIWNNATTIIIPHAYQTIITGFIANQANSYLFPTYAIFTGVNGKYLGILLEAANQGETKKIALPGSIITIPNANFTPNKYYTFNPFNNTWDEVYEPVDAMIYAYSPTKVKVLDFDPTK